MSEPLKPRIDFEQPLQPLDEPVLKAAQAFDHQAAENFYPAAPELDAEAEDGRVEGLVNAALKPRRSLWCKMVTAGLALFGVSVIAQSVQWVNQAWQQQDWIALGATTAGGLIVLAGVGSVLTEWRRLYRLRQRAEERDIARELLVSHGIGQGVLFVKNWLAKQGWIKDIRHSSAGKPRFMKLITIGKWSSFTLNWCSLR